MQGILGTKLGMTQIFMDGGILQPVTILRAGPCVVTQCRTEKVDGYSAVQIGLGMVKKRRAKKAEIGHVKKAKLTLPAQFMREIRNMDTEKYALGDQITVSIFKTGDFVDITGVSKGKGFAGAIKRHGQSCGPMSHGSRYHRRPGSLGAIDPARVFKNQTLPGRMGGKRITALNLEIISIDEKNNLIAVKGSVPGPKRGYVMIKSAILKSMNAV